MVRRFTYLCSDGNVEKVRKALENGADVNKRKKGTKETGLMMAVKVHNEPLVSLLLQQPGIDVNAKDKDDFTALHFAVIGNNECVVSLLLQQPGIDVNAKDHFSYTALHYAALKLEGNSKIINMLLHFPGIDTGVKTSFNSTPLRLAREYKCKVFIEEYRKKMDNDKARHNNTDKQKQEIENEDNDLMTKKRKRERSDSTTQLTIMCEKLKSTRKRQKAALEDASKKQEEDEKELNSMEKKMMEEVDKEYEAKMESLVREKHEKMLEVAEKVKVKREKQGQSHQDLMNNLKKEHKAEEVDLMAEMWKQAGDEQEGDEEKKEDINEALQSDPEQEHAGPLPPAPDCPICFEPIIPPTRFDLPRQNV